MKFCEIIIICLVLSIVSTQFSSIKNSDGSFSIGYNSFGQGNTGDAVSDLLLQSTGWTENSATNFSKNSIGNGSTQALASRHSQILKYVGYFINFIRQIMARVCQIIFHNLSVSSAPTRKLSTCS